MSTIDTILMVEPDGSAHIEALTGLAVGRHRVLLLITDEPAQRDANGWPSDFFAQTYGSCCDDPLPEATVEPPQEREAVA
jgi:hypothetical protein